jgi:hypothetical protein
MRSTLLLLSLLSSLVSATPAPVYPGFKTLWSDGFEGNAGDTPNQSRWNLITKYVPPLLLFNLSSTPPAFFGDILTPPQRPDERRNPNLLHIQP